MLCIPGVRRSKDVNGKAYQSGPLFRNAGQPLADGYYCVWWATQTDLDHLFKSWGGANYKTNAEPCFSCSCNTTTKPWADYRQGHAIWQNHLWTTLSYAEAHPNRHRLWRDVPSGGVLTYIPDVLHSKHLGTDPSFYGGAVYLLTHYKLPGAPEDNLRRVFEMTVREYKKQHILDRYSKITPNMVKQSKAKLPLLKGKASRVKGFGQALVKVFEDLMDSSDPKHHIVLRGLIYSVRIDKIMSAHADAYTYPPDIAEEFEACCFNYCKVIVLLINAHHKADPPSACVQLHHKGALPHAHWSVCKVHEPIFRLMLRR